MSVSNPTQPVKEETKTPQPVAAQVDQATTRVIAQLNEMGFDLLLRKMLTVAVNEGVLLGFEIAKTSIGTTEWQVR